MQDFTFEKYKNPWEILIWITYLLVYVYSSEVKQ